MFFIISNCGVCFVKHDSGEALRDVCALVWFCAVRVQSGGKGFCADLLSPQLFGSINVYAIVWSLGGRAHRAGLTHGSAHGRFLPVVHSNISVVWYGILSGLPGPKTDLLVVQLLFSDCGDVLARGPATTHGRPPA